MTYQDYLETFWINRVTGNNEKPLTEEQWNEQYQDEMEMR